MEVCENINNFLFIIVWGPGKHRALFISIKTIDN